MLQTYFGCRQRAFFFFLGKVRFKTRQILAKKGQPKQIQLHHLNTVMENYTVCSFSLGKVNIRF